MINGVLFQICRGRAEALEQAIESWRTDPSLAMLGPEVEEMVRECLELPACLERLWKTTLRRAFAKQVKDFPSVGDQLQQTIDAALKVFEGVREGIRTASQMGIPIARAAEFEQAAGQIQDMKATWLRRWPRPDPARLAESAAAYQRGEYRTAREFFDELRDRDNQADGGENSELEPARSGEVRDRSPVA